jgi:hypothetical protein
MEFTKKNGLRKHWRVNANSFLEQQGDLVIVPGVLTKSINVLKKTSELIWIEILDV